jgi:hypothetical protein
LPEIALAAETIPPNPATVAKVQNELSVTELIDKIRSAVATEERVDHVQDLAGRNTVEAVMAIQMLFRTERHPKVKAALLAGLGDMDVALVPEIRRQLLATALRREGREVRSTALDLLGEDDSPTATALLGQAMKSDPDQELRDVAAELYRERTKRPE